MANFEELKAAVIEGGEALVKELTQKAIDAKSDLNSIINDGLIAGMNVVGKEFKAGEMFVPEVLMCAKAMNAGMNLIKPLLVGGEAPNKGTCVIGTVKGDLHDIGKNLVGMMLESAGFKVIDLGVDVSPEDFMAAVKANDAKVVGLSALLTTTMLAMKATIDAFKDSGIRDQFKVIIGGAPITQDFSDEIGADGYAEDGGAATDLVVKLLNL